MKVSNGLDVFGSVVLEGSGGSNQIVKQTSANGALTVGTLSLSDLGTGTPGAGKYVDGATRAWTTLPTGGSAGDIDGGVASSTYLVGQLWDGGSA